MVPHYSCTTFRYRNPMYQLFRKISDAIGQPATAKYRRCPPSDVERSELFTAVATAVDEASARTHAMKHAQREDSCRTSPTQ